MDVFSNRTFETNFALSRDIISKQSKSGELNVRIVQSLILLNWFQIGGWYEYQPEPFNRRAVKLAEN